MSDRPRTAVADPTNGAPASLGFRMPAEWERHDATWIAWPHNPSDWPGKLSAIRWVYVEIVRKLVLGERVRMLVNSEKHERAARRALARGGVDLAGVDFFPIETNRGWTRDFMPMFLRRPGPPGELAISQFRFNAWARYPDWEKDHAAAQSIANFLRLPIFRARHEGRDVVLEGGAIDVNGRGSLLTTEECLLDSTAQARNPGLGRNEIEKVLAEYLGAANVLWLGRGIAGDDTHGHVDDFCRFVNPHTVVLCQEEHPKDENFGPLAENRERLASTRLEDGSKVDVVPLPMPSPLYFDGQRLPASYANFYIANRAVLVPTFNDPKDRVAMGVLAELFPGREVIGIHAVDLVWGFGTLHCLTHEQPAE